MVEPFKKRLIVEGEEDKYAIIQLMDAHVVWGNEEKDWPVQVKTCGSYSPVLKPGYIDLQMKTRDVEILGILIDADDEFDGRWAKIRNQCIPLFQSVPEVLPEEGLVLEKEDGKRLGIWIMPDNKTRGMLETFLRFLIPDETEAIWSLAKVSVVTARGSGAKCKECHLDKANIHTWLAWQNPPGEALGRALMKNILNNSSPNADSFVRWFRRLYQLDPKPVA